MEKKAKVTEILQKALKVLVWFVLFLVLTFVLIAGLLQIPAIQTKASKFITEYITENTGFSTSIQSVNIRWWDAVSLKNVVIYDLQDSLMADLDEVYIDFSIRGLLDKDNPGFDELDLKRGNVRLLRHEDEEELNITAFIARINSMISPTQKKEKKPAKFHITSISLEKTSLDILDYRITEIQDGFDYGKLRFRELIANADNFNVMADTVAFDINYLRGKEATSGIVFQQLRTNFTYSGKGMEFENLFLKSNQTEIKNYLKFTYDHVSDLSNFTQKVTLLAKLDESVLDIKDLGYFTSKVPEIEDKIYLSGEISGEINDLFSEELLIRFGNRSALFGKFSIRGLPEISDTYFNLSLYNSVLNSTDLSPYISIQAQKELDKFRDIRFDSDFTGYLKDFVASGNFRTSIGRINGTVNYKSANSTPAYTGKLEVADLDLGILMEDRESFQKVTFKGEVKGSGLTVETALLQLNADVQNIGINQYNYSGISTNATYGRDLFSGKLSIADPNLKMEVDGTLDLRDGKDSANFIARLDTAFLKELNLVDKNLFLSGSFEMDTKGINPNNVEGAARFRDVLVSYEGRDLFVDNFIFQSLFTEQSRVISFNSDLLVAGISGNFLVEELARDVKKLMRDYYGIFTNSDIEEDIAGPDDLQEYNIDINIDFKDPNPIINLIAPNIYISKNTRVEGAFYQTLENTVFNFYSGIDTVYNNGSYYLNNNIDFNTSKIKNSNEVLAAFYVLSKNQQLRSGINFHNFSLEGIWNESAIDIHMGLEQLKTESHARIGSKITFSRDSILFLFEPSDIKLLDKHWEFDPNNRAVISKKDIQVENLKLFHENEYFSVNGAISRNEDELLEIAIHELNLDFLNSFGLKEYRGTANGSLELSNLYEDPEANGKLNISDLYINNFLFGDIDASTFYENDRVNIIVSNFLENKKVIDINGYLATKEDELNMKAVFEQTNLSILEPFLSDYLSQMGGTVSGTLDIGGSLARPEVTGLGNLVDGTLRINYLNTFYRVDGNVIFNPNEISFRGLNVTDVQGNNARMRGGISHDNFSNFILDVSSDLTNFQVLNTSANDNELFYGSAYVSGKLEVFGAANNLDITATATSRPNTRIFIPLASGTGQFQEDFINIINVRDTTQAVSFQESVDKLAINNVRMNFSLDVTPDAYTEIQIDPRTGENIQGRGRGVLNLGIDTQGNFTMTGDFEIVDALYNFSLYNLINKRFTIEPGGRISWYGDPYEGVMDIKAIYEENVALTSLISNPNSPELENSQMKRRFPVKVIMDLKGPLLSPDIAFSFDFSNFPEGEIQTTISAFQNRIANDEQEKNRQVFSLIMLRRFSPEGQFTGAGIGFSNLTQLISSQLNSLIAQVDQNLEIDFDLASLDETALESFQLRVAYTFLDGRLRVTRDGGFTDLQGNADFSSIAGDWQAEYLLTQDGRYLLRVYNRNNFNNLTSLNIRNVNTYGISFSQTVLFSSLKELFQNFRRSTNPDIIRLNDSDDFLRYDFENTIIQEDMENNSIVPSTGDSLPIQIIEQPKIHKKEEE